MRPAHTKYRPRPSPAFTTTLTELEVLKIVSHANTDGIGVKDVFGTTEPWSKRTKPNQNCLNPKKVAGFRILIAAQGHVIAQRYYFESVVDKLSCDACRGIKVFYTHELLQTDRQLALVHVGADRLRDL